MSRRATVRHSTVLSTIKTQNEEINSFTKQLEYIENFIKNKVTSLFSLGASTNSKILEFKKDQVLAQDLNSLNLLTIESHDLTYANFDSKILTFGLSSKEVFVLFSNFWKTLDENLDEKSGIEAQSFNFTCGKITNSGKTIITGDTEGQVILWDVVNSEIKAVSSLPHVVQVAVSEPKKCFLAISEDNVLKVWNKKLEETFSFSGKIRKKEMMEVAGPFICFSDRVLQLTNEKISLYFEIFRQSVQFEVCALSVSKDGQYLAIYDNKLTIYEISSKTILLKYKSRLSAVKSLTFSNDNIKIFICNGEKVETLKLSENFEVRKLKDLLYCPSQMASNGIHVYIVGDNRLTYMSEEDLVEHRYGEGLAVKILQQGNTSKTAPVVCRVGLNKPQDEEMKEEQSLDQDPPDGSLTERRVRKKNSTGYEKITTGLSLKAKAQSRKFYGRKFSVLVLNKDGIKLIEDDDYEGELIHEQKNLTMLVSNEGGFLVYNSVEIQVHQFFPKSLIFSLNIPNLQSAAINEKLEIVLLNTGQSVEVHNIVFKTKYVLEDLPVKSLDFFSQGLKFFTVSEDCLVAVFEVNEPCPEGTIVINRPFTGTALVSGVSYVYLFLSSDSGIEICSFQDLCHLSTIPIPGLSCFCLSSRAKKIYYSCSKSLFSMINPVQTSEFEPFILNFSGFSFDQWKWISSIISNDRTISAAPSANDFLIMPTCISQVLLLAHNGQKLLLKNAIRSGSKYLRFKHQSLSPLTLAICRKNKEIIATLMKEIIFAASLDPNVFLRVEDDLVELNYKGSNRNLSFFYSSIFKEPSIAQDSVAVLRRHGFVGILSPNQKISTSEFLVPSNENPDLVEFRVSALRFKIEDYSQDSVEFLDSIIWSASPEILETPIIQSILLYKWRQVRYLIYYQLLLFSGYLLVLTLFVSSARNEEVIVWILLLFNTFFLICEIPLINYQPYNYIVDPWNILDSGRILLLYSFAVIFFLSEEKGSFLEGFILTLIILLSWIRGLAFFRIFQRTRYLVRIILEVFIDVIPFLIVLSYCILSFAFVGYSLDIETVDFKSSHAYVMLIDEFNLQYLLNFGDINTENYSFVDWVQFFGATVLNSLIMMSMIIALMGNTYERVDDSAVVTEYREMASYVLEIESMLLWLQIKSKKKYFQFCYSRTLLEIGEEEAVIDEKLKKVKEKVNSFCQELQELKAEQEKNNSDCRAILESSKENSNHQIEEVLSALSSINEEIKSRTGSSSAFMTKSLINF